MMLPKNDANSQDTSTHHISVYFCLHCVFLLLQYHSKMPKSEIRIFTYSLMLIKIHELRIVVALFILNLGFHFNTYFVFFMTGTLCFECLSCPCYNVMNVNVKKINHIFLCFHTEQLAAFDDFFAKGGCKAISFVYQESEVPGTGRHKSRTTNFGLSHIRPACLIYLSFQYQMLANTGLKQSRIAVCILSQTEMPEISII